MHIWGSKSHAVYSIPLCFYLGWSAYFGTMSIIRVWLIIMGIWQVGRLLRLGLGVVPVIIYHFNAVPVIHGLETWVKLIIKSIWECFLRNNLSTYPRPNLNMQQHAISLTDKIDRSFLVARLTSNSQQTHPRRTHAEIHWRNERVIDRNKEYWTIRIKNLFTQKVDFSYTFNENLTDWQTDCRTLLF